MVGANFLPVCQKLAKQAAYVVALEERLAHEKRLAAAAATTSPGEQPAEQHSSNAPPPTIAGRTIPTDLSQLEEFLVQVFQLRNDYSNIRMSLTRISYGLRNRKLLCAIASLSFHL